MSKVTFAMPVYNAERFIERSLLSALNQTYPDMEFLIIDDKGQDNTVEIIRKLISEHPRGNKVRIIDHIQNQGIGATRNTAMDNATGEYIFFMDNDDEITPSCIETLYNKMIEHPVDFVAASFVRRDMKGQTYPGCSFKDILLEGGDYPVAMYRYGSGKEIFVASWNKLYNLEFLRKNNIRCMSNHLNEDPWFTYQVILSAQSCRLLPDCTLYYSINPDSVSGINLRQGYSDRICSQYIEIQKLKSKYIVDLKGTVVYPALLADIIFMSFYHSYRILSGEDHTTLNKDRKLLVYKMLSREFVLPSPFVFNKLSLKFMLLYIPFSLPMAVKFMLIRFALKLDAHTKIRKWAHF